MTSHRRRTNGALAAFGLVAVIVAWLAFAPMQIGGQVAYVIVTGNSMEPVFYRDDLVIVRQADDYQYGDIVTYRDPKIGPVIHRIIGRNDDRYILKGDNNSWVDSFQPTRDDLIGKFWILLPSVGGWFRDLRSPWAMALVAAVTGIIIMSIVMANERQAYNRTRERPRVAKQDNWMNHLGDLREGILFLLAMLAFGALALGIFAFMQPLTRTVTQDLTFKHTGVFSYSAAAPPGVYDARSVSPGEPIFRKLTNTVNVSFAYQVVGDQLSDLSGTYRLLAEIGDTSGWKRTVELKPPTTFIGSSFTVNSVLDLTQIQALIDSFEKQTGIRQPYYTLAVSPKIELNGAIGAEALTDQFAPRLAFRLDSLQLQLARENPNLDSLKPTQKGLAKQKRIEPNTLTILGWTQTVQNARWLALIGLLIALSGFGAFGAAMFWLARDEARQVQLKYGSSLITVHDSDLKTTDRVIKVATIDELAKLAEKDGRMILHQSFGQAHNYYVQDSAVTYVYQVRPNDGSSGILQPRPHASAACDPIIEGWVHFLKLRDHATNGHSERVAKMTLRLAQELGIAPNELVHLRRGVLLHDIGKIGIPDSILLKPGPLDPDEWEIMRRHPLYAYQVLSAIPELKPAIGIPYCHHEKWDGTGYPRRLCGEEIPLAARIFTVIDVWDSLRSDRPYRKAWSEDQVIEYIRNQAGAHFDPEIVDAFLNVLE